MRNKSQCEICQIDKYLSLHHIHPKEYKEVYELGASNINAAVNLVLLCKACHACVHIPKFSIQLQIKKIKKKLEEKERYLKNAKDPTAAFIQIELWKHTIRILYKISCTRKIKYYNQLVRKARKNYEKAILRARKSSSTEES